jgi:ribonuclease HI
MSSGCSLASICSNCNQTAETSSHLFFECMFAKHIWNWLAGIVNISFQVLDYSDIWKICKRNWSPQCKVVIQASIINIISAIWFRRNQARFQDKHIHWKIIINNIISSVHLSGCHTSKTSSPDMTEFRILKHFRINIHPPNAPQIKEVIWSPPIFNWIKVNTDGAATKNPNKASAGGIFRDKDGLCIGCFAQNLGNVNAFHAELMAAIIAMEIAQSRNFNFLWLETDSQLVYLALKSSSIIPWPIRNRWQNCLNYVNSKGFIFSHVYREGNACADGMANLGLALPLNFLTWYSFIPEVIRGSTS